MWVDSICHSLGCIFTLCRIALSSVFSGTEKGKVPRCRRSPPFKWYSGLGRENLIGVYIYSYKQFFFEENEINGILEYNINYFSLALQLLLSFEWMFQETTAMKDNIRICPHCHKKVSLWKCMYYFLRNSNYSIRCNHCHTAIWPVKDPIKIEYCVFAGFLSVYLPATFCLLKFHTDFFTSILCALPFFLLVEGVIMIRTLRKLRFIWSSLGKTSSRSTPKFSTTMWPLLP